jgi:triacylglycerol lipase
MRTRVGVGMVVAMAITVGALSGCSGANDASSASSDEGSALSAAPASFADPSGTATVYPIVLLHGFNASTTNDWSFYEVQDALEADGHVVYESLVPPFDSVEVRSAALATFIDQVLADSGAAKVNLVAHSMGGLDARDLISRLGYGDRVASLTTLSTPHRGTHVADVALDVIPSVAEPALDALASLYGLSFNALAGDSHVRAALSALSEANAGAFNDAHPDDSRVYYQSWAGVSSLLGVSNSQDDVACEGMRDTYDGRSAITSAALSPEQVLTSHGTDELPSDGMSTVASAKWGTFRGCIPADHLGEVGQKKKEGADSRTGFDHLLFYRTLAFDLAARGF